MPNERRVQMGLVLLVLALFDYGAIYVLLTDPATFSATVPNPRSYLLGSRIIQALTLTVVGAWLLWRAIVNHRAAR